MKWLGLIVAIVLTQASFLPHAWAQPSPLTYAQPLSQAGVMAVQQRLKQNGAYAGQTDGVWGPDSAAALEQFQRAHGLQVTGQLNQGTVATLGLNPADLLAAAPPGVPTPSASPAEPLSREAIRAVQSRFSPARLLSGTYRRDLGSKHAGCLATLSTGSRPTSDGAAQSCNRNGAWPGSE